MAARQSSTTTIHAAASLVSEESNCVDWRLTINTEWTN